MGEAKDSQVLDAVWHEREGVHLWNKRRLMEQYP